MTSVFKSFLFVLCTALVFTGASMAAAQTSSAENIDQQAYSRNLELLSQLNRIDAEQNPEFEDSKDVLGRRVLDSKNKVVGNVKDIIVSKSGSIQSLNVDFNRLRLNSDIFLNYRSLGVKPLSDAYALSFNSDQIEELYPTLLADINTASGANDETFNVRSVIRSNIKTIDGRTIGVVDDVLFDSEGARAMALMVKLNIGTLRGTKIALPFNSIAFNNAGAGRKHVILNPEMAQALVDYAKIN